MARIAIKQSDFGPKKGSRRVIKEANPWLYAHLYGQDSISNKSFSVNISRKGLPLEYSLSPAGCISYRMRKKDAADFLEKSENGLFILTKSLFRGNICLIEGEDRFYYLHKSWSPVVPE